MNPGEPLLRAIIEDPDDDAPRLVYADWLDEHGDSARATFVRAQVRLSRIAAGDRERSDLVQVERSLWRSHREAWTDWVPSWATFHEFHRGFLESVRCNAEDFLNHGDELRQRTPLRAVRMDASRELAVPVFRSRVLEGLRSLTVSFRVPQGGWQLLAESPYLGSLVELNLSSFKYPQEFIAALPGSSAFTKLRSLRMRRCALGDALTSSLVGHRWVGRLEKLDLSYNHIHWEGGRAIEASPHLADLLELDLRGNAFADNQAIATAIRKRFGERVRM